MNETMNTDVEVTMDVSGENGVSQELTIEESSGGPSKTFVGIVVGGIAAVAIGATVAWKRHKKNKTEKAQESAEEDFEDNEFYVEDLDEDPETEDVVDETTTEVVEEKKTGKK